MAKGTNGEVEYPIVRGRLFVMDEQSGSLATSDGRKWSPLRSAGPVHWMREQVATEEGRG